MESKTVKLLSDVVESRLKTALSSEAGSDRDTAFGQAMSAMDRLIELSKLEASYDEQAKKQELARKEAKLDKIIKIGEIVAVALVVPGIQYFCNMRYAKTLCNFEKDYTFTTQAGKATSKLFRFGK